LSLLPTKRNTQTPTRARLNDRFKFEMSNELEHAIEILYFARARELTGIRSELLKIDRERISLREIKSVLLQRYPQLLECLKTCAFAVEQEYAVDDDQLVLANDEVAVIPPISGG
jgi:sulfur-carrier protein